ncbi:MAG: HPr family phosphocarrier protein [Lachnospiraceae bacterium]|nr:HPr family phosphocarrier protein [Lachnospiraceae bacterium]
MIKKPVTIQLQSGLETRPAALLVQVASQYKSEVYLEVGNQKRVNAKSIMGMMTLGLDSGDKVVVTANGDDEEEAIQEIEAYLTNVK